MITPLDIQNKEFTKSVRGYKEEEVDSFLDLITLDLEKLIADNKRLKDNIAILTGEVERYRGSESTVLETLEAAKALMGDISASAEKRAEILLRNAEMDAERIQREARESVERLTEEGVTLRNRLNMFRDKFKNLLETELERFDTLTADLFPDGETDVLRFIPKERILPDAPGMAGSYADGALKTDARTLTNLRTGDEA
ncbi:MAG: DivIVA domain-containing protein [Clostridiales Family XIII bacterium]|nr:DivIVA domain-containing protein [Clostridiales Family XIII bacterium]